MRPTRGGCARLLGVSLASALAAALVGPASLSSAAGPGDADDPHVRSGRALFVTHCAACHGDAGRGDGASAAAFATKPSNLTDGRLMNPLPDVFLASVIRHGGPAEGLSPGMPPFEPYLGEAQIRDVIAYLRWLASPPPAAAPPGIVTAPGAPRQPILFSHLIHAGKYQID
jgi:mono/diheme cytochrome c family protein